MNECDRATGDPDSAYTSHGYFDPLFAKRIMKRFAEEGVRFEASDASQLDMAGTSAVEHVAPLTWGSRLARNNRVELFIHPEDGEKARKLIEEI